MPSSACTKDEHLDRNNPPERRDARARKLEQSTSTAPRKTKK